MSLAEQIDTTTAAGKMVFRMLAVFSEFERDLMSERTTAAMAVKRTNGERIGQIPYGWKVADDGSTLLPIEAEQKVRAQICDLRRNEATLQAIVDTLAEKNIPSKTGRSSRWAIPTVQ